MHLAPRLVRRTHFLLGALLLGALPTGCTTLRQYLDNGCLVGPNYARPPAAVADKWIDQADPRVRTTPEEHRRWWKVFGDPVLDDLVCVASQQNVTLKQLSFAVLEQEASLGIAVGQLFPQTQAAEGSYTRNVLSKAVANRAFVLERWFDNWALGLGLAWELDLWGKYRRQIESAQDELDASIENYDYQLVQVLADVATAYAQYRILERRLELVRANIKLQEETLTIARARFNGGLVSELDVDQAESTLQQTKAAVPQLEIQQRQQQNQLCVLLGIPPEDLKAKLGSGPIPKTPPDVILGVPADLLRRRPDVRRAERLAAAQCAQIGVAESQFYPAVSINGNIGYQAKNFSHLFAQNALDGMVGPSFNWPILNYGRLANNVLKNEALFQENVAAYQQTVLQANEDVENGVVQFLKSQEQTRELDLSVVAAEKSVRIALAQYRAGQVDFNRVSVIEQNLVQQQDSQAQAAGNIALGLIAVFRGLGGGWQIRLDGCGPCAKDGAASPAAPSPATATLLPPPKPGGNGAPAVR
jgi:NodT family efflux transporter outer membrane factor (OMF) lipoprotein